MLVRKEITWAKTVHTGNKKLENKKEENLAIKIKQENSIKLKNLAMKLNKKNCIKLKNLAIKIKERKMRKMKNREKITYALVIGAIFLLIINMGAINNFLSFSTDKTIEFGHTSYVVPNGWNSSDELNMSENKTHNAMTNGYITLDLWEDLPEDYMGAKLQEYFSSLEGGNYQTLKSEVIELGGHNVTREYFSNPSRNTTTQWDHVGVIYIFHKDDTNYGIEAHYFTDQDYNNQSYTKEIDHCVEDMMANMENKNYNPIFSYIQHGYDYLTGK